MVTKSGNADDYGCGEAKLVVASRSPGKVRGMIQALRAALPRSCIRGTGLVGVYLLEADGDPVEVAEQVSLQCGDFLGRSVLILEEVESSFDAVKAAAIRIAAQWVVSSEPYCFRLNKAGAHWLRDETATAEREIGRSIREALARVREGETRVDLANPDLCIMAEVLGPRTAVGIFRREWHKTSSEPPTEAA